MVVVVLFSLASHVGFSAATATATTAAVSSTTATPVTLVVSVVVVVVDKDFCVSSLLLLLLLLLFLDTIFSLLPGISSLAAFVAFLSGLVAEVVVVEEVVGDFWHFGSLSVDLAGFAGALAAAAPPDLGLVADDLGLAAVVVAALALLIGVGLVVVVEVVVVTAAFGPPLEMLSAALGFFSATGTSTAGDEATGTGVALSAAGTERLLLSARSVDFTVMATEGLFLALLVLLE